MTVQQEVSEVSLFFATKGDAVVYTAKPSLYGVMEVACDPAPAKAEAA